jgi:hypothetical protein
MTFRKWTARSRHVLVVLALLIPLAETPAVGQSFGCPLAKRIELGEVWTPK